MHVAKYSGGPAKEQTNKSCKCKKDVSKPDFFTTDAQLFQGTEVDIFWGETLVSNHGYTWGNYQN